jgi:hypothetical protein
MLDNEKIGNCRFSATFLNTTGLEQIVKVLSHLNNLNYKWDAVIVKLYYPGQVVNNNQFFNLLN